MFQSSLVRASLPDAELSFARSFGRVFGTLFLILGMYGFYRGWALAPVLAVASPLLYALGRWKPSLLLPISRLWAKVGDRLGRIVNPIVLGFIFFVLFTPVALFMRLIGRDALRRKLDPNAQTYWIHRAPPGPVADSIKRPY